MIRKKSKRELVQLAFISISVAPNPGLRLVPIAPPEGKIAEAGATIAGVEGAVRAPSSLALVYSGAFPVLTTIA